MRPLFRMIPVLVLMLFSCARESTPPTGEVQTAVEAPGTPGWDTIELAGVPVLMPWDRVSSFLESDHVVFRDGLLVYLDGEPVGLNLRGASPDQALAVVKAHPELASSVMLDLALLMNQEFLTALTSAWGERVSLGITDAGFIFEIFRDLAPKLGQREFHLSFFAASDKVLPVLSPFEGLVGLRLYGPGLTNRGAEVLAGMKGLRTIRIYDSNLGDRGVETLARMPGLLRLGVSLPANSPIRTALSEQGVKSLASNNTLTDLVLDGWDLRDRALEHLGSMKSLVRLSLRFNLITDQGLPTLGKLTRLRSLDLAGNDLHGSGLSALGSLSELQSLDLGGNPLAGDNVLAGLEGLKSLRFLNLAGTRVGDESLAALSTLTGLTGLNLRGNPVTAQGLSHLSALTGLGSLVVGPGLDDSALTLIAGLTSLHHLEVSGSKLTPGGLSALASLTALRSLSLANDQLTPDSTVPLAALKSLQYLNLEGNNRISPQVISLLLEANPKCRVLR